MCLLQGQWKHFLDGEAKELNGALARCKNVDFNNIHEYDVITFGHEHCSSKFTLACYLFQRVSDETERKLENKQGHSSRL